MQRLMIFFLAIISTTELIAQQVNPGEDEIYRESEVAVIRVTMDPADKIFMLDEANVLSDIYHPAQFRFINSLMDTTLAFNVGIRLRGNTSRYHPKKSFKIKFKEFGGEKFYDLKKFNLKAENNDPTMLRELMSLQTFRKINAPAARAHHAEVYINDEYMGLYLNVEQIDDEFVQARFDYNQGNLYKCYWSATLTTSNDIYNNELFELETNKEVNDRSRLANFISVLNSTPNAEFETAIESVFNVNSYIKILAAEVLTGHWDGYSYNQNNFYLYENNATGLIEFIPYDVDKTFGMDWIGRDWATRDVLDWTKHGEPRPLTTKILSHERYFNLFKAKMDAMLKDYFSEAYFFPLFDSYKLLLDNSISRDSYYPLTFGFTHADFQNGFIEQVADHAPYGLKPYVTTRTSTARSQLGIVVGIEPGQKKHFEVYPNPVINRNSFYIQSTEHINTLQITDLSGRNYPVNVNSESNQIYRIDVDLPSGIYMVNYEGEIKRLIINN